MSFDIVVKPIKYLDDDPRLPAKAPIGYPHIIDVASVNQQFRSEQKTSIADAVVTILYEYRLGALNSFLDLDRPYFHYIHRSPYGLDFCIKRERRMVTVGPLNEREVGGWSEEDKYCIEGEATEKWTPVWFRNSREHETDAEIVLEGKSDRACCMILREPWNTDFPREVELVCGLSHGRRF